jgi:hypothetical protein
LEVWILDFKIALPNSIRKESNEGELLVLNIKVLTIRGTNTLKDHQLHMIITDNNAFRIP